MEVRDEIGKQKDGVRLVGHIQSSGGDENAKGMKYKQCPSAHCFLLHLDRF